MKKSAYVEAMEILTTVEAAAPVIAKAKASGRLEGARAVRGQFQRFYDVMGEPDSRDALGLLQNPAMPQSTKERQEALRARRAMLGMTEVRGIYLPPDLHAELKKYARRLLKAYKPLEDSGSVRS